jgi:hypothetical protein
MHSEEHATRGRRNFLKTAAGAAAGAATIALTGMESMAAQNGSARNANTKNTRAQSGSAKLANSGTAAQTRGDEAGALDRALWVTWYDLPERGRDEYFAWLHGTYLPALLRLPGYLWAAHYATRTSGGSNQIHHTDDPKVPAGYRYILVVGVTDGLVLGNPVPSAIHAELPAQSRKMLATRVGERVNLMVESGRCKGPASGAYREGLTGAPYIQIGSFNCPVEYEEEMHAGYVQKRLPAMCEAASCIRTRKLNSVAGWAKHAILYEFASQEGFDRDYEAANAKSPLGVKGHSVVPMLVHAPNGPNSAARIWPPVQKAQVNALGARSSYQE